MIASDPENTTLYEKAKSKTSVTRWRAVAFFSSVGNALRYMTEKEVMATGLKDLKTVVEKQNELYGLIKQLGNTPEGVERCTGAEK